MFQRTVIIFFYHPGEEEGGGGEWGWAVSGEREELDAIA